MGVLPFLTALLICSVTSVNGRSKGMLLVVYDPKPAKQTELVDVETTLVDGTDDEKTLELPIYWVPCICKQMNCVCCIGIRVREWKMDEKLCVQAALLLPTMRLQISIRIRKRLLLSMSVPLVQPPTICIPTFLPIPLFICVKLSDIVLPVGRDFEGCLTVFLKFMSMKIVELKLGCVRLGKNDLSFFKPWAIDEIVSAEDERLNVVRGESDGISIECIS